MEPTLDAPPDTLEKRQVPTQDPDAPQDEDRAGQNRQDQAQDPCTEEADAEADSRELRSAGTSVTMSGPGGLVPQGFHGSRRWDFI